MSNLEFSDIQGLVFSGYGKMEYACYHPLKISKAAAAKKWLKALMQADKITHGGIRVKGSTTADFCLNIAFTQQGLQKLGIDKSDMEKTFDRAFVDGMDSQRRQKILQDNEASAPNKWEWGNEAQSVDLMLMIFCTKERIMKDRNQEEMALYQEHGLSLILDKPLTPAAVTNSQSDGFRKEHFGFADGISQPDVPGFPAYARVKEAVSDGQLIAAGEFVLGYQNEYDKQTTIPELTSASSPIKANKDFGKNGTYLVFRQMQQDVPAFWDYFKKQSSDTEKQEWLASKCFGRWPSGVLIDKKQTKDPVSSINNSFDHLDDVHGQGCPLGSHIRRSNPRATGLGETSEKSQTVAALHRIIRRGRSYGDKIEDRYKQDKKQRGLFFLCINANIERQFEFMQHTWINNMKFNGLYDERDPVIGSAMKGEDNPMTIPGQPIRKRLHNIERFVTIRGGAYFFLPGLAALKTLANI